MKSWENIKVSVELRHTDSSWCQHQPQFLCTGQRQVKDSGWFLQLQTAHPSIARSATHFTFISWLYLDIPTVPLNDKNWKQFKGCYCLCIFKKIPRHFQWQNKPIDSTRSVQPRLGTTRTVYNGYNLIPHVHCTSGTTSFHMWPSHMTTMDEQ